MLHLKQQYEGVIPEDLPGLPQHVHQAADTDVRVQQLLLNLHVT